MFDDQATISLEESLHTLIIIMRPRAPTGRGMLLLNVSESESRIKQLPGFVTVSFFTTECSDIISEYVQWRSPAHLGAAFRMPAFAEHLAVVSKVSEAEVGFYSLEQIITRTGQSIVLDQTFVGMVDIQILKVPGSEIDAALKKTQAWASRMLAECDGLLAIALHCDREHEKVALFLHHREPAMQSVWFSDPRGRELDRAASLRWYCTTQAPPSTARTMEYVMTPTAETVSH